MPNNNPSTDDTSANNTTNANDRTGENQGNADPKTIDKVATTVFFLAFALGLGALIKTITNKTVDQSITGVSAASAMAHGVKQTCFINSNCKKFILGALIGGLTSAVTGAATDLDAHGKVSLENAAGLAAAGAFLGSMIAWLAPYRSDYGNTMRNLRGGNIYPRDQGQSGRNSADQDTGQGANRTLGV